VETWIVVLAVVAVLLIGSALAWMVVGRRRSESLKRRFGSEYDYAVKSTGSRRHAEADLALRTKRVEQLDIHPLSVGDHDRFADRWRVAQASFVDNPKGAVVEAETLVEEVMVARGYPVSDFDQRAADISVDHPRFVENYREARDLALASKRGAAQTEDLRRATVHFRALFEELLDTPERTQLQVSR
jgi:hypothetical protein